MYIYGILYVSIAEDMWIVYIPYMCMYKCYSTYYVNPTVESSTLVLTKLTIISYISYTNL